MSAPINRALLPGFAKIAGDSVALRSTYTHAMAALAIVALPAAAGIWALSDFIVPVVLGRKWVGAAPLMGVLAVNGGLTLLHSSMATVMIGAGHPRGVVKCNAFFVVFLVCLMLVLVPLRGALGAAYSVLGASALATPVFLHELRTYTGIPAAAFLRALERPLIAALAMAAALHLLLPAYSTDLGTGTAAALMLGGVALGVAVYAACVGLLWLAARRPAGVELIAFQQARSLLRRFLRSRTQPPAGGTTQR